MQHAGGAVMTILYIDTCLLDPYQKDTSAILDEKNWENRKSIHLQWIDEQLEKYTASSQWVLVAGHYPIYSIGEHGDDNILVRDLLPLLLKHKVHAYLNGHDHMHQHIYKDGLHHITSGNSAGRGPFFPQGLQYKGLSNATNQVLHYFLHCGFAFAEVDSNYLTFTMVDNFGIQRYELTMDNPKNVHRLKGVSYLIKIGVSPSIAEYVILVPAMAVVLAIIVFVGNGIVNYHNSNFFGRSSHVQTGKINIDESNSGSEFSGFDKSTDRLKPSGHGVV